MRSSRPPSHLANKATSTARMSVTHLLTIVLVLCSLPITPVVMASSSPRPIGASAQPQDTPTPAPTPDEVLEQARREAAVADELKKKAVADKERAEAEAAKLKAETQPLGPATVTIPTGSVQTDAAGWVESQMLAQEAARQITEKLSRKLCTGKFLPGGVAEALPADGAGVAPPAPTQIINTLVVYNNNDLAAVELYIAVLGQLGQLKKEFTDENPKANQNLTATDPRPTVAPAAVPALLAAPGIATGVIKSVAEVINLFRTDTTFQNKTVQISEDMIISHMGNYFGSLEPVAAAVIVGAPPAGSRCSQSIKIYYPSLFPPKLVKLPKDSNLIAVLNEVEELKNEGAVLLERTDARIKDLTNLRGLLADRKKKSAAKVAYEATLGAKEEALNKCQKPADCSRLREEIKELKKDIAELTKAIDAVNRELAADGAASAEAIENNAPQFKRWLEILADQKIKMQARITATDLLSAKLNTPDPGTKLTALAQLLRAEKLDTILSDGQAFTLRVAVTANGTTKIKKNMFVDAKVRHSAGANVVYQLFNRDGVLAQADVMQCYIGYSSSLDVEGVMSGSKTVACKSN